MYIMSLLLSLFSALLSRRGVRRFTNFHCYHLCIFQACFPILSNSQACGQNIKLPGSVIAAKISNQLRREQTTRDKDGEEQN